MGLLNWQAWGIKKETASDFILIPDEIRNLDNTFEMFNSLEKKSTLLSSN